MPLFEMVISFYLTIATCALRGKEVSF
jgi:hypothetical protein